MLQGVLYKEGRGIIKRHKKRWFVLAEGDNSLRYYKSQHSGNIRGKIEIDYILTIEASTLEAFNKKNCYGFTITTSKRVLNLFARTTLERGYWIDGLNKRMSSMAAKQKRLSFHNHIHFLTMPQIRLHQDMERSHTEEVNSKRMITTRSKSESELIPVEKENRMNRPKSVAFALADVTNEATFLPPIQEEPAQPPSTPDAKPRRVTSPQGKPRRDTSSPPPQQRQQPKLRRESAPKPDVQPPPPPIEAEEDPELLIQRIKDLQRKCEDQHSQIAALATLVEKPVPVKPAGSQRRSQKITNNERRGKIQAEINQFVDIGMWLETKKKANLESTVTELSERLQQALSQLEDEHKKVQYLEASRQELIRQLKQLVEEKERIKSLVKANH